jgi:hypothetical protein
MASRNPQLFLTLMVTFLRTIPYHTIPRPSPSLDLGRSGHQHIGRAYAKCAPPSFATYPACIASLASSSFSFHTVQAAGQQGLPPCHPSSLASLTLYKGARTQQTQAQHPYSAPFVACTHTCLGWYRRVEDFARWRSQSIKQKHIIKSTIVCFFARSAPCSYCCMPLSICWAGGWVGRGRGRMDWDQNTTV